MNNKRSWNILNWNVRGIISSARWDDIRQKIDESACCIMIFQETKRDSFDLAYIKKIAPRDSTSTAIPHPMVILVA